MKITEEKKYQIMTEEISAYKKAKICVDKLITRKISFIREYLINYLSTFTSEWFNIFTKEDLIISLNIDLLNSIILCKNKTIKFIFSDIVVVYDISSELWLTIPTSNHILSLAENWNVIIKKLNYELDKNLKSLYKSSMKELYESQCRLSKINTLYKNFKGDE